MPTNEPTERVRHVPGEPWTRASMLDALERSTLVVERAILVLYARQTEDERATQSTKDHNGMGFNGVDAPLLSSFAEQIERNRYGRPDGQRLTERQFQVALPKVKRYVAQLVQVANERLGVETPRETRVRRRKGPLTLEP